LAPTFTPITMWTKRKDSVPPLDWSWAEERLTRARDYWLVTARPGASPAARPVWGVWVDERLYLTVGSTSSWRNIGENDRVTVHLGDTLEVVVVEGRAAAETDEAALHRMVPAYNAKYDWNMQPNRDLGPLTVVPSIVLAWAYSGQSTPDDPPDSFPEAAGRWTFSGN
jgi:hypothetical protein